MTGLFQLVAIVKILLQSSEGYYSPDHQHRISVLYKIDINAMAAPHFLVDSETNSVEDIQAQLKGLDKSHCKIWDYNRSQAALVLCLSSHRYQEPLLFIDCISCSSIFAKPAWESTNLRIDRDSESSSNLILCDRDILRIVCQTVRLSEAKHKNVWFSGPTALHSYFDLLSRIRQSWESKTSNSFASLCHRLDGYEEALHDNNLGWSQSNQSIMSFQEWLKLKFGYENYSCGWRHVINKEFPNDEQAYQQFFRLVDEYRSL